MIVVESVAISRPWLLLFYVSDGLLRFIEWLPYTITGSYLLSEEEYGIDRLVDYCQKRAGLDDII